MYFLHINSYIAQQCTENFKNVVSSDGSRKGAFNRIQTRLIPSMRFTCSGTIVAYTATLQLQNDGQDPKIQVWRENKAQCGTFYRVSEIVVNAISCSSVETVIPGRIFYCALKNSTQVTVQFGDILGIELPPTRDSRFDLYFTNGGPLNYIFQQRLSSTVDITTRSSNVREQPQITLEIDSGEISGVYEL